MTSGRAPTDGLNNLVMDGV